MRASVSLTPGENRLRSFGAQAPPLHKMAPKKSKAKAIPVPAPEPATPLKKRSRRAPKSNDEDKKPACTEEEPVERIDGVRIFSEAKVRSLATRHAADAIVRLRVKHSISLLPGTLSFTVCEIDDSGEAIFLETPVVCKWEYTYKSKTTPPSGKHEWHGYVRQLRYQIMNPSVQVVYACMVGFVLENLAACRAYVPFLRSHKRGAEMRILSVAIAKDATKKPKTRRFPSEDDVQKNFLVIAQISATKFVVHPGPTRINNKMQYQTAALSVADAANGTSGTKKRCPPTKSDEPQQELALPDDVAEINANGGKHRCRLTVMLLNFCCTVLMLC